ncbi:uncharacterized protein MONBRDRAFT_30035, partial [Monosiga brevicollis MX1]
MFDGKAKRQKNISLGGARRTKERGAIMHQAAAARQQRHARRRRERCLLSLQAGSLACVVDLAGLPSTLLPPTEPSDYVKVAAFLCQKAAPLHEAATSGLGPGATCPAIEAIVFRQRLFQATLILLNHSSDLHLRLYLDFFDAESQTARVPDLLTDAMIKTLVSQFAQAPPATGPWQLLNDANKLAAFGLLLLKSVRCQDGGLANAAQILPLLATTIGALMRMLGLRDVLEPKSQRPARSEGAADSSSDDDSDSEAESDAEDEAKRTRTVPSAVALVNALLTADEVTRLDAIAANCDQYDAFAAVIHGALRLCPTEAILVRSLHQLASKPQFLASLAQRVLNLLAPSPGSSDDALLPVLDIFFRAAGYDLAIVPNDKLGTYLESVYTRTTFVQLIKNVLSYTVSALLSGQTSRVLTNVVAPLLKQLQQRTHGISWMGDELWLVPRVSGPLQALNPRALLDFLSSHGRNVPAGVDATAGNVLLHTPFVVPFLDRAHLFQVMVGLDTVPVFERHPVRISRETPYADAFSALSAMSGKEQIQVTITKDGLPEAGVD